MKLIFIFWPTNAHKQLQSHQNMSYAQGFERDVMSPYQWGAFPTEESNITHI